MRAARLHGTEDLRIDTVEDPSPLPGQVKIKNAYAGICGSDLHMFYAELPPADQFPPHPLTGAGLPQILGHEFSGTVVELGAGVTDIAVGDRVAVWPIYFCGECAACRGGRPNACVKIGFHGLNSHGGGMAEFTTVDASKVHVLPEQVDLRFGALVEPMAVAWHAVTRSAVASGGTALIAGAGPIGIGIWFALRARGITRVLVSEPSAERREVIAALGATTIDPVAGDLPAAVAELTGGDGVDVAFDAAGAGPAITSAIPLLTPGGRLVVAAIHERPIEFMPTSVVMAETEIVGTLGYLPEDFDAVIEAMSNGHYDATGWVTEIGLDDVTGALATLRSGRGAKFLVRGDS
ncbi:2,3-butanediol dehydrogenase [Leucobacter luti]|uniref:(R,R)-butanediol dehydrogenase/meso-butanediol dehydrogenase/diacetyl reductase n=1 Tax=Leucobacter luti TaxID=340320 RepID=A0A4Q7U3D4_9MICO|nr:2,3-butanediol dehydrogenase [Leucobacter luti]MBL3699568.1 2,3-butanediol dehydrogenase [Leucobacter luti]RZT67080.1 (R,R)-butanediol dehydrogenase/meso-butanediol dehydrogenase/diacetyl reductase [Leucobacter luti]